MFGISLLSYCDNPFSATFVIIASSLLLSGAISFAATFLLDALGTINKNIVSINDKLEEQNKTTTNTKK